MTEDPYRKDFRNFVWLVWKYLGLPEPAELQYDIADYLQSGPDRRGIKALRGAGKSYLTAAYAVWRLYREPSKRILVISAAAVRAIEFVRLARMIIELVPEVHHLRPRVNQIDGANRFEAGPASAAKDPSVSAYGITSMITGTHPDIIIADDVETSDNALTIERRQALYQKCMEFEMMMNPGGDIIYLGTPQSLDSIYKKLGKGYKFRVWPAEYPDPNDEKACMDVAPFILNRAYSGKYAVRKGRGEPGDSTYPERFSNETLREREATMGWSNYSLQMLLDTNPSDEERYPLKLRDFIVFDAHVEQAPSFLVWGTSEPVKDIESPGLDNDRFYNPIFIDKDAWRPYQDGVMYIDPSGRGKDETGYCVAKSLNGLIYVLASGGYRDGYSESTLHGLAEIAKKYKVKKVVWESNYGDGMYGALLLPILHKICGPVAVEERRVTGQKELRLIDTLEPAMNSHRIIISRQVALDYTLMKQIVEITRDRGALVHDDRIEALEGAVNYFVSQMVFDAQVQTTRQKQAEAKKEIAAFIKSAQKTLGRLPYQGQLFPDQPIQAPEKPRRKLWGRLGRKSRRNP